MNPTAWLGLAQEIGPTQGLGQAQGFDQARWVILACMAYVILLLVLGGLGRRAMVHRNLAEFFLAGRNLGFLVLLLTLFATQYSGNSMSAFPGKTYRSGLSYIMSVTFMTSIVSGYLLFAPQLFRRARKRRYLTPSDFLADRFGHRGLCDLASTIFAVTLCNFLLAQLMAMGHAFSGLTAGAVPYWVGVVGGATVILIYELLGGMRAVAWTDAVQGVILALGLSLVLVLLTVEVGTPAQVVAQISELAPAKAASPDLRACAGWLSTLLLLGLGAPLYPQAIQRIYAARRLGELRRALACMAWIPLFAITTVVFIGAAGIVLFPGLEKVESDKVTFKVLAHLVEIQPLATLPVVLVMMAVVAAIMSTADSALLSLTSILTKDFFAPRRREESAEEREAALLRLAPVLSVAALLILGAVALSPRFTLWRLLEIKFEILIQLSPAFVLGTLHERGEPGAFSGKDVLRGLGVGLSVALGLYLVGWSQVAGLHAGTIGVVANYVTVVASRRMRGRGIVT